MSVVVRDFVDVDDGKFPFFVSHCKCFQLLVAFEIAQQLSFHQIFNPAKRAMTVCSSKNPHIKDINQSQRTNNEGLADLPPEGHDHVLQMFWLDIITINNSKPRPKPVIEEEFTACEHGSGSSQNLEGFYSPMRTYRKLSRTITHLVQVDGISPMVYLPWG